MIYLILYCLICMLIISINIYNKPWILEEISYKVGVPIQTITILLILFAPIGLPRMLWKKIFIRKGNNTVG